MGLFNEDVEVKKSEGLEYKFGESAAVTLQRWSKILIEMQKKIVELESKVEKTN